MLQFVYLSLAVFILTVTVVTIVLTVQVYHILAEVRQTVRKTNNVIDNADSITESVARPMEALSDVATHPQVETVITGVKVLRSLFGRKKNHRRD